ncbi:DegT/DnrJ/EryC1/StrS family aminotransferase [Streptosporangium sp. NPDC048047]|uniref:DegT/DnrJ/EryC1/StrS family aminotransferase n=1 Tax=Streptosporangium sp. NPDC048047 TaxID=3155748 RepID=UPI00342C4972
MSDRVPVNDLGRSGSLVEARTRAAVNRVLESGRYILGAEVDAFERDFAAYCGTAHCVGVANGTDAIELALRALGVGSGSRVATVANAGSYTTTALAALGAHAVFVDVDPGTMLMDPDHLKRVAGGGDLDAVVVTHLYGLLHDMGTVLDIAAGAGVPVLEDCAQAHGARRDGRTAGSFGAAAAFSFYPTKNLGALGDAGAVVTGGAEVAERVRLLRQYGWQERYRAGVPGGRNSRLDEMQAAVLRARLPFLDGWNDRRREIAARYSREIRHPRLRCPAVCGEEFVAHLYVVACEDREALRAHLAAASIGADVHYPVPEHLQPVREGLGGRPALPVTEELAGAVLTLPCHPGLSDEEVTRVISRVNSW